MQKPNGSKAENRIHGGLNIPAMGGETLADFMKDPAKRKLVNETAGRIVVEIGGSPKVLVFSSIQEALYVAMAASAKFKVDGLLYFETKQVIVPDTKIMAIMINPVFAPGSKIPKELDVSKVTGVIPASSDIATASQIWTMDNHERIAEEQMKKAVAEANRAKNTVQIITPDQNPEKG